MIEIAETVQKLKRVAEFGEAGVLSVATVSEALDLHTKAVTRMADRGVFRWMRHSNGSRGIDRNDVLEYMRTREQ